jgi:dephospho-CoA kinase
MTGRELPFPPLGRKWRIGLVGGIGAGKSRVGELCAERGAAVIAGDPLGHAALEEPTIRAAVVARWGTAVLNIHGAVDRKALAQRVFADPAERSALQALVFPYIEARFGERIARAENDPTVRFVVLDAAVMLEAGWNNGVDCVVYVHVPRSVRVARLLASRGWTPADLVARETAQWPLTLKVRRADVVWMNAGAVAETARQIDGWLLRWGIPLSASTSDRSATVVSV